MGSWQRQQAGLYFLLRFPCPGSYLSFQILYHYVSSNDDIRSNALV